MKLSVARIYHPVKTLGPGDRVGIWVNGCEKRCLGCISPEMQKYDPHREVSVVAILEMVRSINARIDGFTISGGEPFLNPEALNELVYELKKISDDILIFSGYTIEQLREKNDPAIDQILGNISVLIDGPFEMDKRQSTGLRGSSNQTIHVFKHKEKYENIEVMERSLQTIVYGNGVVTFGIPTI